MKRVLFMFEARPRFLPLYAESGKDFGKERLNNSPRHGEWVDIKSGDRTIKAFVVYPERKDKAPVVLVTQEIFGLTDWLRSLCDELAENGVIAIAPDFLQTAESLKMPTARSKLFVSAEASRTDQITILDATQIMLVENSGYQRDTRHLRILPGRRMGVRIREHEFEIESGLLVLRNCAR